MGRNFKFRQAIYKKIIHKKNLPLTPSKGGIFHFGRQCKFRQARVCSLLVDIFPQTSHPYGVVNHLVTPTFRSGESMNNDETGFSPDKFL